MAGFFSLQPQPEGQSNLSDFSSGNPSLEHIGSTQSYIDPSQGKGETLHRPFEAPADLSVTGNRGTGLMNPTGDQGYVAPTEGTSSTTGARTNVTPGQTPRQQVQGVSGTQLSDSQVQTLQNLGMAQTALSKVPDSLIKSGVGAIKDATTGAQTNTDQQFVDTNSQDYKDWLQSSGYSDAEAQAALGELGINVGAGAAPSSFLDKTGAGDIQSVLGLAGAGVTGDPVQIAKALNSAVPNVVKYITDDKEIASSVGGVAGALGGAYSIYQGTQSGDPKQIIAGIGQLLQGGSAAIGMKVISQMSGISEGTLGQAFGALGGITGGIGLANAIQNGDPVQAILSAASIYSALSSVAPTVFTPLTALAAQALIAIAPELAASLGITVSTVAGVTTASISALAPALTAISGAVTAWAGPVAALAIVATEIASWSEERNNRRSGWWNNPIAGGLYSKETEGMQRANDIIDQINTAGVDQVPTDTLMQALPAIVNSMQYYYEVAQGGEAPITPTSSIIGLYGRRGLGGQNPTAALAEYTGKFNKAQQGLTKLVDTLMDRGVTYEQLAALPVEGGDYVFGDLEYPEQRYYAQTDPTKGWTPEAQRLWQDKFLGSQYIQQPQEEWNFGQEGGPTMAMTPLMYRGPGVPGGGVDQYGNPQEYGQEVLYPEAYTPQYLFNQVQGAAHQGPDIKMEDGRNVGTNASGLVTGMFGGPLWYALAAMGADQDPRIHEALLSHFDPWFMARNAGTDAYANWAGSYRPYIPNTPDGGGF